MLSLVKNTFLFFCIIPCLMTLIASTGLLFVWSATYTEQIPYSLFFKKQLFGILSGTLIFFIFTHIEYKEWMKCAYFLYPFLIALLVFTLFKGSIGMGGQRWIDIGFMKFQPSEIAKILLPACATFHLYEEEHVTRRSFIFILFTIIVSFILIRKQPDLGSALIILFVGLFFCWLAGIGKQFFIISLVTTIFATPLLWHLLKPYQKERVLVFLGSGNKKKEAYQKEQALIAIGSGSISGKGLLKGTQNKMQFLPEGRTDFIFAVLCEEWGFLGALYLLFLYAALFLYFFITILFLNNGYMQLLALSSVAHIMFSTIINIAMVLGMLPIVGIPLPLFSYGITHLWITYASLGVFQQIISKRTFHHL